MTSIWYDMQVRGHGKRVIERSRSLRRAMTPPERLLWHHLRAHRMGFQVERQHALAGYFLDFYVHLAKLCIEQDGKQHADEKEYDEARDAELAEHGILTVRVSAARAIRDAASVARQLYKITCERSGEDPLGWYK